MVKGSNCPVPTSTPSLLEALGPISTPPCTSSAKWSEIHEGKGPLLWISSPLMLHLLETNLILVAPSWATDFDL